MNSLTTLYLPNIHVITAKAYLKGTNHVTFINTTTIKRNRSSHELTDLIMTLCSCLSIMVAQLLPFTTAIDLFLDPATLSLATVDSSFSANLNDCTVDICSVCGVPSM